MFSLWNAKAVQRQLVLNTNASAPVGLNLAEISQLYSARIQLEVNHRKQLMISILDIKFTLKTQILIRK